MLWLRQHKRSYLHMAHSFQAVSQSCHVGNPVQALPSSMQGQWKSRLQPVEQPLLPLLTHAPSGMCM